MADILLKKYSNRRLYDTSKSVYVNLSQIAEMIREGNQIQVVDVKSGEDVTGFILTQVVLEEIRKKNAFLPPPALHLLIRFGDKLLGEFFGKYLHLIIQNYLVYRTEFDAQFQKWLELGMDLSELTRKTLQGMTPFQSFFPRSQTPKQEKTREDEDEPE